MLQAYRRPLPDPLVLHIALGAEAAAVVLTIGVKDDVLAFVDPGDTISTNLTAGYVRQIQGRLDPGAPGDRLVLRAPIQ
jgi:hypothetical protein